MFSYNPEAMVAKPKNVLNKRLPYAINSNPISKDLITPLSTPPIGSLLPNNFEVKQSDVSKKVETDTKVYNFEKTINIFKELVESSPELGKKATDIQKRLQILETMWREGKLNLDVQNKTSQMAEGFSYSVFFIIDSRSISQ